MTKYVINIELSFHKKPSKFDVECKLWDLIKEGFVLKTKRRKDKQIGKSTNKEIRCITNEDLQSFKKSAEKDSQRSRLSYAAH